MKVSFLFLAVASIGGSLLGQDTQTVTLNHKLQIPGAVLKPGEYTFAIEDRMEDRAIIRITNSKKNSHELLLAVPNPKLNQTEHGKLLFFATADPNKQILQGWMCSNCPAALEVVYPKAEAVKVTAESAKSVMAVDPTYDKLPKNLSPDDMKVVTLWLLSPKEITPDQKGKGVAAAKYADIRNSQGAQTASVAPQPAASTLSPTDAETQRAMNRATAPPPPGASATTNSAVSSSSSSDNSLSGTASASNSAANASPSAVAPAPAAPVTTSTTASNSSPLMDDSTRPVPTVSAKPPAAERLSTPVQIASTRRMPHTASNTYNFGLAGLVMVFTGLGLHLQRRLRFASEAGKGEQ